MNDPTTQEDFLPFSKPSINAAAIQEVISCLESGWITTGPRVKKFEEHLGAYLNASHVAALSSATAGLHLALLSLDLQPGDEVITTPFTFVATLNSIVLVGATPILIDIDETYNMDVNQLAEAITPRTKAIIPVHFAGLPVDLDPLYEIANAHQLRVLEDAAQAIGSIYKERQIGSFGDIQIFSFHPNKNMTTGEGGCLVTHDKHLAEKISVLRFHGIDRMAWDRYGKKGDQNYDVLIPGYKYNMMDIQAAIGIHQLAELETFIQRRTQLAQRYQSILGEWPELTLPHIPDYSHRHSWHLFAPLINPEVAGINRDTFMKKMKEHNIGTGLHYNAAHLFSYYRQNFGYKEGDFPNTENIAARIVSLPLFPAMTEADQDRVITAMTQIFQHEKVL